MLLTLRGAVFLYYGDELGMPDTDVPVDRMLDPVTHRVAAGAQPRRGADADALGARPGCGVHRRRASSRGCRSASSRTCNVADQRVDPDSTLHLTRDLIALRRELVDLRDGGYEELPTDGSVWAWRRGASVVVALNLGDAPASLDGVQGTVRLGTSRGRDGEQVAGALVLGPWEAVVVMT